MRGPTPGVQRALLGAFEDGDKTRTAPCLRCGEEMRFDVPDPAGLGRSMQQCTNRGCVLSRPHVMMRDPGAPPPPAMPETRKERAARQQRESEERLEKAIRGESLPSTPRPGTRRVGVCKFGPRECVYCTAKFVPKSGNQRWCGRCPKAIPSSE